MIYVPELPIKQLRAIGVVLLMTGKAAALR